VCTNRPIRQDYLDQFVWTEIILAPAHLIDANDMDWWPMPMTQPVLDRPLHDRRYALPVQSVMARRSLPTQLPRQHRHRIGQGQNS
jgi:hypothetical protein